MSKNPLEEIEQPSQSMKRVRNAVFGCKNNGMILFHFQDRTFNITVIPVCVTTTYAKETEVEQFYEDLKDLLEHQKKMSFSS